MHVEIKTYMVLIFVLRVENKVTCSKCGHLNLILGFEEEGVRRC